jgi:hypothetical protein
MTDTAKFMITPRIEEALAELKEIIRRRYPEATFDVGEGDDPEGIYLNAVVEVDNLFDVIDLYIDRLVDMQIDEGLPIFVMPNRTPERNAAIWAEHDRAGGWFPLFRDDSD